MLNFTTKTLSLQPAALPLCPGSNRSKYWYSKLFLCQNSILVDIRRVWIAPILAILVIWSLQKAIVNGRFRSGGYVLRLISSVSQAGGFVLPCHCFKHLSYLEWFISQSMYILCGVISLKSSILKYYADSDSV